MIIEKGLKYKWILHESAGCLHVLVLDMLLETAWIYCKVADISKRMNH